MRSHRSLQQSGTALREVCVADLLHDRDSANKTTELYGIKQNEQLNERRLQWSAERQTRKRLSAASAQTMIRRASRENERSVRERVGGCVVGHVKQH